MDKCSQVRNVILVVRVSLLCDWQTCSLAQSWTVAFTWPSQPFYLSTSHRLLSSHSHTNTTSQPVAHFCHTQRFKENLSKVKFTQNLCESNSEIYNIPTKFVCRCLETDKDRKEGKMSWWSWKQNKNVEKTVKEGNEAEFPPSEVNPCVFSTFLPVAYISACLISGQGSRRTPEVSMCSHQETSHQNMDNPQSQIRSETPVERWGQVKPRRLSSHFQLNRDV